MIVDRVSEAINDSGIQWKLDTGFISPEPDDVQKLLDEAARLLYDEPVGSRLTTGGMLIEKREDHLEIYVYFGEYY